MDDTGDDLEAKVVILGDSGVGKTSLTNRFIRGQFDSQTRATVGATHLSKKLSINGVPVKLNLWDTAGQERFRSLAPMYYRGAQSAVLVYDITSPASFESVLNWVNELHNALEDDILLYLVGNKVDLAGSRQVPRERAVEFARDVGAYFVEISARENIGIDQLFGEIAAGVIHQKQIAEEAPATVTVGWSQYPVGEEKKDSCCS